MKNTHDPNHLYYLESRGLLGLATLMKKNPEVAFEEYGSRCLRADKLNYLTQKFPRFDFESTSEWAQAIINEIMRVLLPQATTDQPKLSEPVWLLQSSEIPSDDQEAARLERLHAAFHRSVKHLVQIKASKQMLGLTYTERAGAQPGHSVGRKISKAS